MEEGRHEPKIGIVTAILIGMLMVALDLLDLLPAVGYFTDILGFAVQFYLYLVGVKGTYVLISNIAELIPVVQEFPTRTITWIITVAIDHSSSQVAQKLETVGNVESLAEGEVEGGAEGAAEGAGAAEQATEAAEETEEATKARKAREQGGEEAPEQEGESEDEKEAEEAEKEDEKRKYERALGEPETAEEEAEEASFGDPNPQFAEPAEEETPETQSPGTRKVIDISRKAQEDIDRRNQKKQDQDRKAA